MLELTSIGSDDERRWRLCSDVAACLYLQTDKCSHRVNAG